MRWIRLLITPIVFVFLLTSVAYAHQGPGRFDTPLYADGQIEVGTVSVWNTRKKLHIRVDAVNETWKLSSVQIYVGVDPVPVTKGGIPHWEQFPYEKKYNSKPMDTH